MVTAVMAAPVPPPTIAAMPIIAQVVTPSPSTGWMALIAAPKAPPMVAPMNSDGEKMPPEAPEPRLTEVAHNLAANSSASRPGTIRPPERIAWIVA